MLLCVDGVATIVVALDATDAPVNGVCIVVPFPAAGVDSVAGIGVLAASSGVVASWASSTVAAPTSVNAGVAGNGFAALATPVRFMGVSCSGVRTAVEGAIAAFCRAALLLLVSIVVARRPGGWFGLQCGCLQRRKQIPDRKATGKTMRPTASADRAAPPRKTHDKAAPTPPATGRQGGRKNTVTKKNRYTEKI